MREHTRSLIGSCRFYFTARASLPGVAHALILGHTIHLEIPDDLYQALRIRAGQTAMTLEQVAAECLSGSARASDDDDAYIGRALAEKATPRGNP